MTETVDQVRPRLRTPNLANFVRDNARTWPQRVALRWGEKTRTWAELDARVDALASALSRQGVTKGDAVLLATPNRPQFLDVMFATMRLGAVIVPVNFRLTPHDVAVIAETTRPVALVVDTTLSGYVQEVRPWLHGSRAVLGIGPVDGAEQDVDEMIGTHLGQRPPEVDTFRGDPAWYFSTSGSSGRPKAAVLTHDQLAFVAVNYLRDLMPDCSQRDVSVVVAPLSHGAGTHMLTQVASGAETVLLSSDSFDAGEVWGLVENLGVTNMFTVPTIVKLLIEHPAVLERDHSSLRQLVYAGAPMYRADQKLARERVGNALVQFYGMAEVTSCITYLLADEHDHPSPPGVPFNTCGRPRTGMQISIQDESGQELAPGGTGEVCVCGEGVFSGYLDNESANHTAFRAGWFRTGDLGFVDAHGYLFLTGRASDMYISGGSNIDPRELEEKILEHESLDEVAVVGIPDAVWGEVGVAVCVPRAGQTVTPDELLIWMRRHIARYKLPKRVLVWNRLPRSDYGKVTKQLVREEMRLRGDLEEQKDSG